MFSHLSTLFYKWAKGRIILALLTAFILFMALTLPLLPLIYRDSSNMTSLDDPAFYTPARLYTILEAWGPDGRTYQLGLHLTWDIVVPVLGFFIFALGLSWLLERGLPPASRLRSLNLLAFSSAFDLLENFSIAVLILAYPSRLAWAAWLKTAFTLSKFAFLIVLALLLTLGLLLAARKRFQVQVGDR